METTLYTYHSKCIAFFFIMVACSYLFCSCLEEPKIKLSQTDSEIIDSIFSNSVDSLRDHLDSLCLNQRDKLFNKLVDSITQKRLAEIETIYNQK